tara:strand:- start:257 stop:367 length:111 start_codon:yes stop_codon:yes gene_type:complete
MSDKLSAPPETTGKDFVPAQTGNKKIVEKISSQSAR